MVKLHLNKFVDSTGFSINCFLTDGKNGPKDKIDIKRTFMIDNKNY